MPSRTFCLPEAVYGLQIDHVPDEDDTSDLAISRVAAEHVRSLVARLPERERNVIRWHYGLDCEPLEMEEIARRMGVTSRTVHNWQATALRLLHAWF
jgi:RNA polymerase sigma factor (sigma-70 family)